MSEKPRLIDVIEDLPNYTLIQLSHGLYAQKHDNDDLRYVPEGRPIELKDLRSREYRVIATPPEKPGYLLCTKQIDPVFHDDPDVFESDLMIQFSVPERQLAKHWIEGVRILTLLANRPGAVSFGNYCVIQTNHLGFMSGTRPSSYSQTAGVSYFDSKESADRAAEWMNTFYWITPVPTEGTTENDD